MRWLVAVMFLLACGREGASPPPTAPQQRIVSLTPSATEVLAALDATALLVGVDDYSTYPPAVTTLPKVGSFMFPNIESIVLLKPTLVVVDDIHGKASGALNDAGVATVACAMHSLPDVKAALATVGARIGRADAAARVTQEIEAALDAARAQRPAKRTKVLAIIDREAGGVGQLVAAGPGSWVDELLAVVGAENVLAASGVRYPKISREEVLRGQPDVVLDLSYAARTSVAEWKELTSARVVPLSEPFLVAPSPRVTDALAVLAKATTL